MLGSSRPGGSPFFPLPCTCLLYSKPVHALDERQGCAAEGDLCAVRWGVCVSLCCVWSVLLGWELWLRASEEGAQGAQVDLPYVFWQHYHLAGCLREDLWWDTQQRIFCCVVWHLCVRVACCCQVLASVRVGCWAAFKAGNGALLLLNSFPQSPFTYSVLVSSYL